MVVEAVVRQPAKIHVLKAAKAVQKQLVVTIVLPHAIIHAQELRPLLRHALPVEIVVIKLVLIHVTIHVEPFANILVREVVIQLVMELANKAA